MKAKHPESFPGSLRLQQPYGAWILLMAKESPACYINDAKDTGKMANVEFEQGAAETSFGTKSDPWYTFMRVRALREIQAGEELLVHQNFFLSYFT